MQRRQNEKYIAEVK